MGKRNVAKITVDGTDYTLMQFSDFSYIPNRYDATRYQMELANGIYYPTGVSVQGNTMNDIIPQGIGSSADNVSKPIDNYNAILLKQVPVNQGNANFFSFYNSSNELLFEEGYLMTNYEANTLVNFAIVIDDDGFADVIGVMHYYNGSITATRIDHFGGNGEIGQKIYAVFAQEASQSYTSNGGGATHIAKVTGQLKDLSSNLSDILMVSGGGGGGLLVGETEYAGKEAGGISGSGDNSADQSTGNAFGQGESGTNVSGGGSGLYGGYKGTSSKSGGAGSGYIGNSLLSNKKMVGYNVPTSSAEGTKTESTNEVSASAVSGKPKSGNGFARIKFLRDFEPPEEYRQYIDNINGSGFDFIKNLQVQTFTGTFNGVTKTFPNMQYEPKTLSWYSYSHNGTDVPWSKNYFSGATSALFCSTEIDKVYITSNNGTYTCTITKDNSSNWSYTYNIGLYNGVVSGLDNPPYYNYGNFNDSLDYISNHNCNPWYTAGSWATQTFTGTLEQVFQSLQRYARNIDIYVDGVLWSKAGL